MCLKVLIVHVRILSRVNSNVVASTLIFNESLTDVLAVPDRARLLHRLYQAAVLSGVLHGQALDHSLQLHGGLIGVEVGAARAVGTRLQRRSLDAIAEPALFPFPVQALHPVLDFVQGFLLAVEALQPNQIVSVGDEVRLNRHI